MSYAAQHAAGVMKNATLGRRHGDIRHSIAAIEHGDDVGHDPTATCLGSPPIKGISIVSAGSVSNQ
jgi:hypothetical protein